MAIHRYRFAMPKAASQPVSPPTQPRPGILMTASIVVASAALLCRDSRGELAIHVGLVFLLVAPLVIAWFLERRSTATRDSATRKVDLSIMTLVILAISVIGSKTRSLDSIVIAIGGYAIGTASLDAIRRVYRRIDDAIEDSMRLVRVIALPWFVCILIAGTLLALPIATQSGVPDYRHNFVSHVVGSLHSAVSAACLVGTFTLDFAGDYTRFGQIVIVTLTQLSGFAFAAIGLSLVRPLLMRPPSLKRVLTTAAVLQLIGCAVLFSAWRSEDAPTFVDKCWWSLVHAGSALWNSGITMRADGIAAYFTDRRVFLSMTTLAIAGSMGIPILYELLGNKAAPEKSSGLRLGRVATFDAFAAFFLLLLVSAALFYLEHPASILGASRPPLPFEPSVNQPAMVDNRSAPWVLSVLVSATVRSAGIQSIPTSIGTLSWGSYGILLTAMFVGGGMAGTAGGIRTSLFGLVSTAFSRKSGAKQSGKPQGNAMRRFLIGRCLKGLTIWIALNACAALLLGATTNADRYDTTFDAIAAVNSVGLSTGLLTHLTTGGRIAAIILLLAGRLWPILFWARTVKCIGEYQADDAPRD